MSPEMSSELATHKFKSIYHEIGLVSLVSMSQILCQGSIAMSLSIMDFVLASFPVPENEHSTIKVWFMASFALTVGTFILISGKMGDLFGLKKIILYGWIWEAVASLLTGLSYYTNSVIFFIICRALQGIGFALLLPCGMGVLGNVYPNGFRKNLAFSCVGAAGPTGATLGALFAAIIAQYSWWPWSFFIVAILSVVLFGLSIEFIPKIDHVCDENGNALSMTWKHFLNEFDYLGSICGCAGLIMLNFVVTQGPLIGWGSIYIIVLMVLSVVLIVGFFVLELYFIKNPLLPRSIFNYKIGLVLATIGLGWGSFGIWQYYYWVIILELRNNSPVMGGLTYIPIMVMGIVAAYSVAFLIHKVKPSFILCCSSVAFLGGCIMLAIMPVEQSFWRISFGQLFILCWGMDLSFAAGSIILSDYLPKRHQGMAGSLISTVVNYSVSLFLSLGSNIEISTLKEGHSEIESYRNAIYFAIGIAGLGVLISLGFLVSQIYNNDKSGTFTAEKEDLEVEMSNISVENRA